MSKKYIESESLKRAMWENFYREEDKWESMPEADFLDVHGGCPRHWFQLGFSAGLDAVVKAEPVPHEMTAREFLVAYKRMCASFPETDCSKCPVYTPYKDCTDNPCDWEIDKILPAVERWAREHPEDRSEE